MCQFSFARQFHIALKLLQFLMGVVGGFSYKNLCKQEKEVTCSIGHVIFVMY